MREAVARVRAQGLRVKLVVLRLLAPLLTDRLGAALEGVSRVLIVEQNHSAQLHRYLRSLADLPAQQQSFHRAGPLPLRPGELAKTIAAWRNA